MDSIGTFKARWLMENINPRYPIDLQWFSQLPELGLDKPVKIEACNKLPKEVTATLVPHPKLSYYYIIFNPIYCVERIRFGIAHELGHLYLGHEGYAIGEDEDPEIKTEADDFASEVLMPYFRVRSAAGKLFQLNPISLAYKLKDYFWVSMEAICRRLLETDVIEGAYVLFDVNTFYFSYTSKGLQLELPVKRILTEAYKYLKTKETSFSSHWDSSGRMINFYVQKFSNGKVFGAFSIAKEQEKTRAYDNLIQEIINNFAG